MVRRKPDRSGRDLRGDRGVSEVVGFILVFSLVVGTITMVYVGGFAALDTTRDSERVNNAERAFDVLAENFQQLARGEAPRRATEIKLAGAELSVQDSRRVTVTVTEPSGYRSYPIYFSPGTGTHIVYEHGAVIRDQEDGAVMLKEPDYVFDEDLSVIQYKEVRGGTQSVSGDTTVLARGIATVSEVDMVEDQPDDVTVTLNTSTRRADVWEEYFDEELAGLNHDCTTTVDGDVASIECQFDTERIHVAKTRISVSIVG